MIHFRSVVLIFLCSLNLVFNHLTHVIMPFHPKQLNDVLANIRLWSRFRPCDDSMKNMTFLFFSSSSKNLSLENALLNSIKMDQNSMMCFKSVHVSFANLPESKNDHLLGSRLMFEQMLSKHIFYGETEPHHVFYMEPDCVPVRPNWLNVVEASTAHQDFWMKGSIFRGDSKTFSSDLIYNHIHINGNAIYNVKDQEFKEFYFGIVRKLITSRLGEEGGYDADIFKVLLWKNAKFTSCYFHKFIFSDFVINMWHTPFSISQILADNKNVVLMHGGQALQ
jgi:hypothetical protein